MAGGVWFEQNKVRPGFYLRFVRKPGPRKLLGERGVVALPLFLPWGEPGVVLEIDRGLTDEQMRRLLGYTLEDEPLLLLREAFKRARKVLVYRVNGNGAKASLQMNGLKVTAKYPGARGNDIQAAFTANPDDEDAVDFSLYLGGVLRERQTGLRAAADIGESRFVAFEGNSPLTAEAGGSLAGGTDGTATVGDYLDFTTALEAHDFNAVGFPVDDPAVKALAVSFTKRMIEQEGKLIQCVLPKCDADYEAVSSVQSGVILKDGTRIDYIKAVAWFAAASADAEPYESLTYAAYDGAVAPDTVMGGADIIEALQGGHIVFVAQKDPDGNPIVVVEQDINTLRTFTTDRPKDWRKNRVVRALFQFGMDMYQVWHLYYIGKVSNNFRGRELFKGDVVLNVKTREEQGVFLENAFDPLRDIVVDQGEERDAVLANVALTPVDAMEKLYMTVEVI